MIILVFGGEAVLYSLRERRHMWSSRPGTWVIVATAADIVIISTLAVRGIAMQSLPIGIVGGTLAAAVLFAFLLDLIKVPVFRRTQIADPVHEIDDQPSHQASAPAAQGSEQPKRDMGENKANPGPISKARVRSEPEAKIEPKAEAKPQPEANAQPELKDGPKSETGAKTPSDPTPQLVERVHKLYEELGREDVRTVQEWEKAEPKTPKDEPHQ
jgi:H+-transporting ATPase